eukprot:9356028-Pyramimonas_sp.AAC.1
MFEPNCYGGCAEQNFLTSLVLPILLSHTSPKLSSERSFSSSVSCSEPPKTLASAQRLFALAALILRSPETLRSPKPPRGPIGSPTEVTGSWEVPGSELGEGDGVRVLASDQGSG